MLVKELRELLDKRGLSKWGNRAELLVRLHAHDAAVDKKKKSTERSSESKY